MQIAQEPSDVGRSLGGHDAHEDPACGAVNGDEQITSGGFIRHLWQVFHVDMKKTRLIGLESFVRLCGCLEPQSIEIAHTMAQSDLTRD